MSRSILLTGLQCSGNAAVAGVLHHLGVHMGDEFSEPSHHNPKGYFDDQRAYKLLKFASGLPFVPNPLEANAVNLRSFSHYVCKREGEHALWGLSLPILCIIGHLVLPYFKSPRLIFAERDFDQTVESFLKMTQASKLPWPRAAVEATQALYWLGKQELIGQAMVSGVPILVVPKAELATNIETSVRVIAEWIYEGLEEEASEEQIQEAMAYVDPSLHHEYEVEES